ncbi:hypothetical protein U1Q18_013150 [Sarracenia purpurea var. burkii]
MSNEEDIDERQHLYVRKYYKMVNQFDELIEIMDANYKATQPKRRRVSSSPRKSRPSCAAGGSTHVSAPAGGRNGGAAAGGERSNSKPTATRQVGNNSSILVQTITRHLEDLKNDYPSDSDRS